MVFARRTFWIAGLYGLIALVFTTIFLVVLIADIVGKALPAFTQGSLLLDVAIPADLVPPDKRTDPGAIRSADYFPLLRDALKAAIPGIEGRSAERTLTRLLSPGAADRRSRASRGGAVHHGARSLRAARGTAPAPRGAAHDR